MTDINQYLVEHEVIPEQNNLIIQETQEEGQDEAIPNIVHLNGKLTESQQQETLHSNVPSESEDDDNSTQLTNTLEQLSIQSTNPSLEAINEEQEPQLNEEQEPQLNEEQEEQEQTIINDSNTEEESLQETTLTPILESVTEETSFSPSEAETTPIDTTTAVMETTVVDNTTADTIETGMSTPDITAMEQLTSIAAESTTTSSNAPQQIDTPPRSTTTTTQVNGNTNRGRSVSSVNPSTTSNGGLLPRSQRVWEMDRQAPECRRCHRRFNFLIRRHHCRRCGQIVCDKCSSHRIRLPVEELIEDPMISQAQYPLIASQSQRVCDTCYREPVRRSSDSHQRRSNHRNRSMPYGTQMRRTDSSQSLMIDCPVCGQSFLGMQKNQQEEHLQQCLNVGSPPVHAPRYIVYKLSEESTQIGDECPICFEEFKEGDKVSRMICLCSYHQHCLASWLERGKGCPVHYDTLHSEGSY